MLSAFYWISKRCFLVLARYPHVLQKMVRARARTYSYE